MSNIKTQFGSMKNYVKGHLKIINDSPKRYAFSNLFDVAKNSKKYEKIVVAKNLEYAVEVIKCVEKSEYYVNGHDEFALVMDGDIEVSLFEAAANLKKFPSYGAEIVAIDKVDKPIGRIHAKRGHMILLPMNHIYQINAKNDAVILLQTMIGKLSCERWSEICVN